MDARAEEIHPGEILREEFMKPLDLTATTLAVELNMPVSQVDAFMSGENRVTESLANSLAAYFKMSAQFWLNLQAEYDARTAASK